MQKKSCLFIILGLILALTAFPAWAAGTAKAKTAAAPTAADVCVVIPTGGTPQLNIAVASNLWDPMTDGSNGLVQAFQASDPDNDVPIQVCHNSTGTLVTEITTDSNPTQFGLFLAANTDGPGTVCQYASSSLCLSGTTPLSPFPYINGVPALFTVGTNTSGRLIDTSTGYINLTNMTQTAIADPTAAPYGKTAETIMKNYTQQYNDIINPPSRLRVQDNIDLTFQYVLNATDNGTVGYVAKSQICGRSDLATNSYSSYPSTYLIPQSGAILNITSLSTSNEVAQAFVTFLLDSAGGQSILTTKFCYQAP
jgi:ABC-type molybdate transport system substrate-binding protein